MVYIICYKDQGTNARFDEVTDFEPNKYIWSSGKTNNKSLIPNDRDWKMSIQFNKSKVPEKTN